MATKLPPTVTLNVRKVDRDIARKIKAEAARHGVTIAEYLAWLVRKGER